VSPGGHLLTTLAACAASAALGGPPALTAGIAVGGFLIDVDHAFDYVVVERQRDLRPGAFLRYYLAGRVRRVVLVLHAYETFALLAALAWWLQATALWGYLLGGLMHLGLDLAFNGALTPRSIVAFYSFGYRLAHGFDAVRLFGPGGRALPPGFWAAFFIDLGRRARGRRSPPADRPRTGPSVPVR
jgi:hypothetical protein